jgi:F0F1-type ATP synthase membrane subunit b/b'
MATKIFEYSNWSMSTIGLIICLVILLNFIIGFLMVMSNIKFTFIRKLVAKRKFKIDMKVSDTKRIYKDYDTHFEEYDEQVSNYQKNKINLQNEKYSHQIENTYNRENRPFYIMKVFP